MHFVSIHDKPPLRLLRQVGNITDEEFAEFLKAERKLKLRQALKGERWVDVYDIRSFVDLSPGQRKAVVDFVGTNLPCIAESTMGVAFVTPPTIEQRTRILAHQASRHDIAIHVGVSLDEALEWALELAFDQDTVLDADLVLGGIDAFRFVLQ